MSLYACADSRQDRSVMAPYHAERHAQVDTALTASPCRGCPDVENPKNLPPCSTCERRARAAGFERLDDAFNVFSAPDPGTQLVGLQATLRGVRERAIAMFREGVPADSIHGLVGTEQARGRFLKMMRDYYPEFRLREAKR
ncbi:MAG: hypothetical protein ABIJ95_07080 [Pseudomonadota bacterium]